MAWPCLRRRRRRQSEEWSLAVDVAQPLERPYVGVSGSMMEDARISIAYVDWTALGRAGGG